MRHPYHVRENLPRAWAFPIRSPNKGYWWGFGDPRPIPMPGMFNHKLYPFIVNKLHNKWQQFRVGKVSDQYMMRLWTTYSDIPFFQMLIVLEHSKHPHTSWNEVWSILHHYIRLWEPSKLDSNFLYEALRKSPDEKFEAELA